MSDSDTEVELEALVDNLSIDDKKPIFKRNFSKLKTKNFLQTFTAKMATNDNVNKIATADTVFQSNISAMTVSNFNTQELTALTNSLPEFAAGKNLSSFISAVDNLCIFLNQQLTATQTYLFNLSILSKINDDARLFIY